MARLRSECETPHLHRAIPKFSLRLHTMTSEKNTHRLIPPTFRQRKVGSFHIAPIHP